MSEKNNIRSRVYDVVKRIHMEKSQPMVLLPPGSTKSARTVGWAMNNSHKYNNIPAHRVVNRNGVLTGKHHFPGSNLMKQLLENEGIIIKNDKIVDFDICFWDPEKNKK